jgi:hypothetical protein
MDTVFSLIAAILTIMVLSRVVLGDNPLFRVAQYLFVGVSLGLAFVVVYYQVLSPAVRSLAVGDQTSMIIYGVPLALGLFLLPRITRLQQFSWLANIPLALVFGVGAALAISGAVLGTLLPQIVSTANAARLTDLDLSQLIGGVVLVVGTIATLAAFYYTAPRETGAGRTIAVAAAVGHWLLMIAFGFFFAGAVQSYMSALTGRLQFLLDTFTTLF